MTPSEKLRKTAGQELRPDLRPELRDDDPRARAAKRAAEIRQNLGGSMDDGTDEFAAPPPPDGWTYEWKRKEVFGKEDHTYQTSLLRKGWEPVPAERYPEMMPAGNYSTIERKGMILMERPKELTDEARDIEKRRARQQVRVKEEQLAAAPPGQFERSNKDNSLATVKRSFQPIDIPKD